MNIKGKLYISVLISVTLIVFILFIYLVTVMNIAEADKKRNLAEELKADVGELNIVTHEYLLYHEKRMDRQWNSKRDLIAKTIEAMETSVAEEPDSLELVELLRTDYGTLSNLFLQIVTNHKRVQKFIQEEASQAEIDTVLRLEERLTAQLLMKTHSMLAGASKFSDYARAQAANYARIAAILVTGLLIFFVLNIAVISVVFYKTISRPLDELSEAAAMIGRGDLEHKVKIVTKDEIGTLGIAFNKMAENLKKITASRDELNKEIFKRQESEKELKENLAELERFRKATIDREFRIEQLCREIERLKTKKE